MVSASNILVFIVFPFLPNNFAQKIYTVQDLANRPITSQGCQEEGHLFPDYETCGVYHRCQLKGKNNWNLKTLNCPEGQSFFEEFQSCENVPCEVREPWPDVPPYFPCNQYSQYRKYQVPGDCHLFYICIWTGSHYTYKIEKCVGGFFNEKRQKCESSTNCPQVIRFLPSRQGLTTIEHYAHADSCIKYYILHPCLDAKGKKHSCVKELECPAGLIYKPGSEKNYCDYGACEVEVIAQK